MTVHPVLIDGAWRASNAAAGTFTAVNPATKTSLPDQYPISDLAEVERALHAASKAAEALQNVTPEQIAGFFEAYAKGIEARAETLVEMANQETALPKEPRLRTTELPRTTNQLRQAAAVVHTRSWCLATIDSKTNIRSKYGPLGPIVVFGPNNFPYAFNGISGGDFAAAIAAGNPVIAKAHPAHPSTTRLLAEAAFEAVTVTGLPPATVQLIYHMTPEVGLALVAHPLVGATGFTGSRAAGMRLKEAADQAGKPFYAEMSSVNPVFVLPGAVEERLNDLVNEFTTSCLLGTGQFCTNPGLVILLQNAQSEALLKAVSETFQSKPRGVLLSERGPRDLASSIDVLRQNGAQLITGGQAAAADSGYAFENTLLRVSGETFLQHPEALQTEAFGPESLFVFARDEAQLLAIAGHLHGNLTGSIYSQSGTADEALYAKIEPILRRRVGRLLNDKMPTGVAVSSGMNHGGPYPATGHPGFTSVGLPASIVRFAMLYCYDNVRLHRLPPELQNKNPTGTMWRLIDGEWSQRDIPTA